MRLLLNFINESINLWIDISPYLILGMFISGLLHVFIGKAFISRQLGKGGFFSILKATLLGTPLPVCSCGVIPIANSLSKDGAHKSSVLAFLVSTPTTGVDSIMATYSLMGPLFAIFRPLASIISGIFIGMLSYIFDEKQTDKKNIPEHSHYKTTVHFKFKEVVKYAFYDMPKDMGKWLLMGTLTGGFITAVLPKELFQKYFAFPFDFIVLLLIGIPLYVCATGSIPIAVSLIGKGFSPGAALVFLIAGPATNAITLSFVWAKIGKKSFFIYLLTITAVAILLGLTFNFIWDALGSSSSLITGAGEMLPMNIKVLAGIFLILNICLVAFKKKKHICEEEIDYSIRVEDIHCDHCKIILEDKLKNIKDVEAVWVDTTKKIIHIKGAVDKDIIFNKIRELGYMPKDHEYRQK